VKESHLQVVVDWLKLIVKELTPSLRDDFLLFFDHVAFVDNPDWSDCYCSAYENPFLS
jgi:hypothetical protein